MFGMTRHFLKGWRTRIFALLVTGLGILEAIDPYILSSLFGYRYQGLVILFIGMLTFVLRELTDSPPGSEGNTESWWASTADEGVDEDEADTGTSV